MKIVAITDLHNRKSALERILAAAGAFDLVVLGGDLTEFGTPADAGRIVRLIEQQGPLSRVVAVAGNCDSARIDRRLDELGVGLHGRGVIYDSVGFQGLSAMPPWRGGMYELSEEELARFLNEGAAAIASAQWRVVVAHAPPFDTALDRTSRGQHVGSRALRTFIDSNRPHLVVCGHIHEGRGVETIGSTVVVNCGEGREGDYAVIEIGATLSVELRRAD